MSGQAPILLPAESRGEAQARGRLEGRRILIIGGGQDSRGEVDPPIGNGRAMAILFSREGANVAVADRDTESAEETCRLAARGSAIALGGDMADAAAPEHVVQEAANRLGSLDGLVYNVGIALGMTLEGTRPQDWDTTFAVNLRAAMLAAKAALPRLSDGGSIVFISSIASLKPGSRMPSYDASKAGMAALMRHVAMEGAGRGIRANIVTPGLMDTSIGRMATRGRPSRAKTPVPLGRQGTGWETAYAALYLMSHEAAYVTGQTLVVDGGLSALR